MKQKARSVVTDWVSFDRYVSRCRRDWSLPGVAVGIVDRQGIIHAKGYGLRDIHRDLPVTADTIFPIASCTKAFAAAAVGILVDDGRLQWDRPLRDYLPGFALHDPVANERATIRDVLCHRTGLPPHDWISVNSAMSRSQCVERLRFLQPMYDFRSTWCYNSHLYSVAGAVVDYVSGITWEQFVEQRILAPLGMCSSWATLRDIPAASQAAIPYEMRGSQIVPFYRGWPRGTGLWGSGTARHPAGSLHSTVKDMCQWLQLHVNQGQAGSSPVLNAQTLKEVRTPQIVCPGRLPDSVSLDAAYAMGWIVQPYRGFRLVHHWGGGDATTFVGFVPERGVGVVVLCNRGVFAAQGVSAIALNAVDRLLGLDVIDWGKQWRSPAPCPSPAPRKSGIPRSRQANALPLAPEVYAGTYTHPGYGSVTVSQRKGHLVLRYNEFDYRMRHEWRDVFRMVPRIGWWGEKRAVFHSDSSGSIASVAVSLEPRLDDIVFRKA